MYKRLRIPFRLNKALFKLLVIRRRMYIDKIPKKKIHYFYTYHYEMNHAEDSKKKKKKKKKREH